MEIRNRQQHLGFGTVNAKFHLDKFKGGRQLLDSLVGKMKQTGDTVELFTTKNMCALKIDSSPQREQLLSNLLTELGIVSTKLTDNPLTGKVRFIRAKAKMIFDMNNHLKGKVKHSIIKQNSLH